MSELLRIRSTPHGPRQHGHVTRQRLATAASRAARSPGRGVNVPRDYFFVQVTCPWSSRSLALLPSTVIEPATSTVWVP